MSGTRPFALAILSRMTNYPLLVAAPALVFVSITPIRNIAGTQGAL
jgi:hypothetical protein